LTKRGWVFANRYGWLFLSLLASAIYVDHIWKLTIDRSLICGKDYFLHAVLAIKYAQLKFSWPSIISLYASLEQKAYALQLHYPPLSYLSSISIYSLKLDPFRAAVVTNIGWMILATIAIYALVTRYTGSGFWGFIGALSLLSVYWVKCTVFDIGWRIPALSMGVLGVCAFAFIVEGKNGWWRWAIIGFVTGVAGLVHVLAIIPIFSVVFVEIVARLISEEEKIFRRVIRAIARIIGVRICAALVMAVFYLPVFLLAPKAFLREIHTEGVINWEKIAQTFSALPHDFFELFSDNWRLTVLVLVGLAISPLCGKRSIKMFFATLVLLVPLFFGSTYNGWFYLIPYLAVVLTTSVLGISCAANRLGKIGSIVVGILMSLILLKSLAFNLKFDECLIKDKMFCTDYGEIQDLASALKKYSDIPQDKIGFVDCRRGDIINPGDIALVAMALGRPQDSTSFWPYVHLVYNYQIAKIQLEKLQEAQLIGVITDELDSNGAPVCKPEFLESWQNDIGALAFDARFKAGRRWVVFYKKP